MSRIPTFLKATWLPAALFLTALSLTSPANAESFVVQNCGTLPKSYSPGSTRLDVVDVNGNLCTNASGGGGGGSGGNVNVTEVASTAIGNFGSNPGAVPAIPTNSSVISSVLPTNAAEETGGNLATAAANTGTTATNTTAISGVSGTTAGAAVTTDANGTIQQYLRGLIKQIASVLSSSGAATSWLTVWVENTTPNGPAIVASSTSVSLANVPPGAATVSTNQLTIGASATLIAPARTGVAGTGRTSITITNPGTTSIYIGGSGVTTSTGTLLPGISGASMTLGTEAAIYGIVATSTATVSEFEIY